MSKNLKILSLGDWPKIAKNKRAAQISPITKRILSQVHIKPQLILPITYERYVHLCTQKNENTPNREDYEEELERRSKQVDILIQIRNSYILGKDYGLTNHPAIHKQKEKLRVLSKYPSNYSNASQIYQNPSNNSKLSRVRSQKSSRAKDLGLCSNLNKKKTKKKQDLQHEQSEYFVNFSQKYRQSQKSLKGKEESTQIRQLQSSKEKMNRQSKQQYGYYEIANNAHVKQRKKSAGALVPESRVNRVKSSKILYQELLHTLQAWQDLDQKHLKEVEKISQLSKKERDRLLKIQSIEKQQMQSSIKNIKKRLNSQSKSIRLRDADYY